MLELESSNFICFKNIWKLEEALYVQGHNITEEEEEETLIR